MIGRRFQSSRGSGQILISLRSLSDADYSVDARPRPIPVIDLEIINDILWEDEPSDIDKPSPADLSNPDTSTPSPTATWLSVVDFSTATQDIRPSATSSRKSRETATSTSIPSNTPTIPPQGTGQPPTWSPAASNTPQPSRTLAPSSTPPRSTPVPTSPNPPPTATQPPVVSTPTPNPQPSPTQTPQPSPTPQPVNSPTPTLVVIPTSTYTPASPGYPYPEP